MVNVISNGQKFNITESLYESILKNNPELLNEKNKVRGIKKDKTKKKKIPDYVINKDLYADIFKKIYGRNWFKSEEENSINVIKKERIDNTSDFEKILIKIKEKEDEEKAKKADEERKQENYKNIERINKQKLEIEKRKAEKEEEKLRKSIISPEDKEKIMNKKEKEYVDSLMNQLYKVVDSYLFKSDVPDNIVVFYADVENEFNSKNIPGTGKLFAQFKQFGKEGPIPYIANTPKSMYVDYVKNNNIKTNNGIEIWRILKEIPIKEFWKNVAIVTCTTEGSYSLVTSLINNIQNNRDEIECFGKQIPTGFNTRTMVFTIVDRKSYLNNDLNDIRKRQTFVDMKKIGKNRENNIDKEKNARIYPEEGEVYKSNEETLQLLNNLKRQYFIIVTEGMFKKGKLLKNIGNKFKKFMPSLDTNYKNLFNDN